jgi:tight adherence protein B
VVLASAEGEGAGFGRLSRVAACWRVAATSGTALAPVIERVGDALHDEIDLARDVESSLAGPRSTIRLLAGLPIIGLVLGAAIGARPLSFLLDAWAGRGCLTVGVGLDLLGIAWAGRIAGHALRLG